MTISIDGYKCLLHYGTVGREEDYFQTSSTGKYTALAQGALSELVEADLLISDESENGFPSMKWKTTAKGRALIKHILDLPLPEEVVEWRMPDGK